MKFSIVIITYNEEKNIRRCLNSVMALSDDIIVVDSFSSDNTEKICSEYKNLSFIQKKFEGYSEQKNFANSLAKHDFIFSIDADEAVSPQLAESILRIKDVKENNVFWINRLTNYCGKWIRYCGWYPDKKERIWNRNIGYWEGKIHEKPQFKTDIEYVNLSGDLLHYSYYTIAEHKQQTDKFARLSAIDLHSKNKKPSIFKIYLSGPIKFIRCYIFKLGFLEGYRGYQISIISAKATYLKYSRARGLFEE